MKGFGVRPLDRSGPTGLLATSRRFSTAPLCVCQSDAADRFGAAPGAVYVRVSFNRCVCLRTGPAGLLLDRFGSKALIPSSAQL